MSGVPRFRSSASRFLAALAGGLLPLVASSSVLASESEVRVVVPGQGLSSVEVERAVTVPLELGLASLAGLVSLDSRSSAEGADLRLRVKPTRADAWPSLMVVQQLNLVQLPQGMFPEVQARRAQIIYRYTVESAQLPSTEVRTLQDTVIEPALLQVSGVSAVTSCGGSLRRVEVVVDPPRLAASGLSLTDFVEAVGDATRVASQPGPWIVQGTLPLLSPQQLGQLSLGRRNTVPIRISDVANVMDGAAPLDCLAGRDDRQSVLAGQVWLRDGDDAQTVQGAIHARLAELRAALPASVLVRDFGSAPGSPDSRVDAVLDRLHLRAAPSSWPRVVRVRMTLPPDMTPPAVRSLAAALRDLSGRLAGVESTLTLAGLGAPEPATPPAGELELLLALRAGPPAPSPAPLFEALLKDMAKLPAVPSALDLSVRDALGRRQAEAPHWVGLRVRGNDLNALAALAERIRTTLASLPQIRALRVEGARHTPHLQAKLDRATAARYGVAPSDVTQLLSVATSGATLATMHDKLAQVPVVLRLAGEHQLPASLPDLYVTNPDRAPVPLRQLVSFSQESTPTTILRQDHQRCVLIHVTAPALTAEQLVKLASERLRELPLPADVSLAWDPKAED